MGLTSEGSTDTAYLPERDLESDTAKTRRRTWLRVPWGGGKREMSHHHSAGKLLVFLSGSGKGR